MTSVRLPLLLWTLAVCAAVVARADERWPAWDAAEKLTLAQAIAAECSFNTEREAAAIGWVFIRRWRRTTEPRIDTVIKRYCSLWNAHSYLYRKARQESIRASDAASPPGRQWARIWQKLGEFVDRFAAGKIKDPCPGATHFGGPMDTVEGRRLRIVCGQPEFANTFYAEITKGE